MSKSSKVQNRFCTACGERYHRRHLTEMWVLSTRNGIMMWNKMQAKICMICMDQKKVRRVMHVAQFALSQTQRALLAAPVVEIKHKEEKRRNGGTG